MIQLLLNHDLTTTTTKANWLDNDKPDILLPMFGIFFEG
jgi:hypothetical protein